MNTMELLLNVGAVTQVLVVVTFFAGVGVGGLYTVRRQVPLQTLKENHEVAGFIFGVLGAFYGVVLAFVLVAAWQRYEKANEVAQSEAVGLAKLYNVSKGFSQPARSILRRQIESYLHGTIEREWPAMARWGYDNNQVSAAPLWDTVLAYKPADAREQTLFDQSLQDLAELTQARRLRYLYYSESLPSVVWLVIYIGCIITIGFSYFFGLKYFRSQALMCGTFAALIGLTILAITELAHPYQGDVTVSSLPFKVVLADIVRAEHAGLPN